MIDHKQYAEYVRYVAEAHQERVLPTAKAFALVLHHVAFGNATSGAHS